MWFDATVTGPGWAEAERFVAGTDPAMAKLVATVGPCTLRRRRDYFIVLLQSIFSQQISVAGAELLFGRFRNHFPNRRPTPGRTVEFMTSVDPAILRGCGLSRQKQAYVLDLARHFDTGKLPTARLSRMDDEAVVEALTAVRGIGRWTAEMFLIFTLNRPDVWPVDDLGLRKGVQRALGLAALPSVADLRPMGDRWRPWRSVATWYFWRVPAGFGSDEIVRETPRNLAKSGERKSVRPIT